MTSDDQTLPSEPTVAFGYRPTPQDEPSFGSAPTAVPGGASTPCEPPQSLGRIDQYELIRKLGGGGFGVVYLARDTVSGIDVALKTLHPLMKSNAEEMERLREKFALVSRLSHPNIASALVLHPVREVMINDAAVWHELRLSPGDSVMVMRYAPGITLSKWRRQFEGKASTGGASTPCGPLVPLSLVLEVGRQIAAALDYAHDAKIVHRDIKPANVMVETLSPEASQPRSNSQMVSSSNSPSADHPTIGLSDHPTKIRVRILDFGLAAEIRSSMSRVSSETGDTSGTRPYMAPEQWKGEKQDGRTDQYALACVLYELLSGEPPFAGVFETGDPVAMRMAVEHDVPARLEGMPRHVNDVLRKALSKERSDRFGSCCEFMSALGGTGRFRKCRFWLTAAAVAVAAGGLWFAVGKNGGERSPSEPPIDGDAPSPQNQQMQPEETHVADASEEPVLPVLPPEGASLADLEDALALLEARRDALSADGYVSTDPERTPVEDAIASLEKRIEAALAEQSRKAREEELAGRRSAAQRAADLAALADLKSAVERRVASLDATWNDGEFAKRRKAILDAKAKLAGCTEASSLARAKELRGDIYDDADWIERNTPARNGLVSVEKALDELAGKCSAASADKLAAATMRKAERARKDAETRRDGGRYEDAAKGYGTAKSLYDAALAEARAANAAAEVESARTYRDAKLWQESLAAATKALEWEPGNKDALALKTEAQSAIDAERKAKEEAERMKREAEEAARREREAKAEAERAERERQERERQEAERRKREAEEAARRELEAKAAAEKAERERQERERNKARAGEVHALALGGGVKLEMVYCPGIAPDFWMGKYEVTQEQWQRVMGRNPSKFVGKPRNPVESVSWNECQEFVRKLNALSAAKSSGLTFRLPSEEEWETACRAGAPKSADYCKAANGTQITAATLGKVARYNRKLDDGPVTVGSFTSNAWGLYDMHGNVWEWTSTAVGDGRVFRGGGFDNTADGCPAGNRSRIYPGGSDWDLGFRLAASGSVAAGNAERERQDAKREQCATKDMASSPSEPQNPTSARPEVSPHQAGELKAVSVGSQTIRLHWCPAGSFMMGSPSTEKDRDSDETQHRVTLTKGFWMGEVEVTQGLWKEIMGKNPSYFKLGNNYPVENVSWNDCQEFLRKLNARPEVQRSGLKFALPTETQWEYACRAGTTSAYGGTDRLDDMGWYTSNSSGKTHPVGQKKANAWELYDMHGNVWEWCHDWCGDYLGGAQTDPVGPSTGSLRIRRGGGLWNVAWHCRSADRNWSYPDFRDDSLGLRLVASGGTVAENAEGERQDAEHKAKEEAERKKRESEIRMITEATFPPYEFRIDREVVGIDVEICKAIAREFGKTLAIEDIEFENILPSLIAGKAELAAAGITITENRKKMVDFSHPYIRTGLVFIYAKSYPFEKPEEAKGKRIGVQHGTISADFVRERFGQDPELFDSPASAFAAMKSGKVDVVIADIDPAKDLIKGDPNYDISDFLTVEEYAIAIKKGQPALLATINKVIDRLISSGELERIIAEWTNRADSLMLNGQ